MAQFLKRCQGFLGFINNPKGLSTDKQKTPWEKKEKEIARRYGYMFK